MRETHFPVNGQPGLSTNISKSPSYPSEYPVIVGGSQVLWRELKEGQWHTIYYSYFDGTDWSIPEDIAQISIFGEHFPQAAIGGIHIGAQQIVYGTLHFVYALGEPAKGYEIKHGSNIIDREYYGRFKIRDKHLYYW